MIPIGPLAAGGATAGTATRARLTERHVLALGLGLTALLVVAAGVAAALSSLESGSPWAAIHLAMAGAATVAIGTFMPHFAVTLAGTRPRAAPERLAAVVLLGTGAIGVVAGVTGLGVVFTGAGTLAMLAGLGVVAWQTFSPLRDPLARRHHVVTLTYGAALVMLAVAVALGALAAVGASPIVTAWAQLRPAHVWLGLFGAVSLTIFATLVYLAPTVLGARIRPSPWLAVGVAGMLVGPVVVAAGFTLAATPIVAAGMAMALAGAVGQAGYLADVLGRRGRFTSEHDWRLVASGHLVAGAAWYTAALAGAFGGILVGAPVHGWSIGLLAVPTVAGWLLQELVGSWTHLTPSVTPGSAQRHARQRRYLAVASRTRLVVLNAGVALTWAAGSIGHAELTLLGALMIGAVGLFSVGLLVRALSVGRYERAETERSSGDRGRR